MRDPNRFEFARDTLAPEPRGGNDHCRARGSWITGRQRSSLALGPKSQGELRLCASALGFLASRDAADADEPTRPAEPRERIIGCHELLRAAAAPRRAVEHSLLHGFDKQRGSTRLLYVARDRLSRVCTLDVADFSIAPSSEPRVKSKAVYYSPSPSFFRQLQR